MNPIVKKKASWWNRPPNWGDIIALLLGGLCGSFFGAVGRKFGWWCLVLLLCASLVSARTDTLINIAGNSFAIHARRVPGHWERCSSDVANRMTVWRYFWLDDIGINLHYKELILFFADMEKPICDLYR